jgi:hypothetical protein
MPVVKDRRSSLRVEVEGRARIHTNRDEFAARCVDLGLDGIAVRSTRAARPGELVTLELQIDGQWLRSEAKLVRRQRTRGEYLLGLSFVDLDLDTRRRIEHMLFERLAGSPQGEFMRAFVAHADRVPPPAVREAAVEHTVVAGVVQVPVISGHTQVIVLDPLPTVDRTVIAPAPLRSDDVHVATPRTPLASPLVVPSELDQPAPGVPDGAWLDDEMDTEQFRLLEAAQAREAAEREANEAATLDFEPELARVEPQAPVPENTVVVSGFAVPRERTAITTDVIEPSHLRERTLVTSDAPVLRERTLVTSDFLERPPAERTIPVLPAEVLAERTLPFLRDLLPGHAHRPTSLLGASERTAIVAPPPAADSAPRPTVRALLDAVALLRGPDPTQARKRGPRVVVAIPHRTHRRVASMPWNRK